MDTMILGFVFSVIALTSNIILFCAVLSLSKQKAARYDPRKDLIHASRQIETLARNQSLLWRYLEGLDDHVGADAHRVLGSRVPHPNRSAGH